MGCCFGKSSSSTREQQQPAPSSSTEPTSNNRSEPLVAAGEGPEQQQSTSRGIPHRSGKQKNSHDGDHRHPHTGSSPPSSSAAYFTALPPGAKAATVVSIYDGDTLTVCHRDGADPPHSKNETKVRLIGIDTPELKQKEPFAVEAKEHVIQVTHFEEGKRRGGGGGGSGVVVYLVAGPEAEDHYGRSLCYVFCDAPQGSGFICVNVSLVEHGLAKVYFPGSSAQQNGEIPAALKQAQASARSKKLNLWKNLDETAMVFATTNGKAYHREGCEHLRGGGRRFTVKEVVDKALTPCRTCHP